MKRSVTNENIDKACGNDEYIMQSLQNGYPVCLTGWNTSGKYLSCIDFSKITGLTVDMLNAASAYESLYLMSMQFETVKSGMKSGTIMFIDGVVTEVE